MQRERITEDIFVFISDRYAQVTAGVVITDEGALLIDTLMFPDETRSIKRFVEERLGKPIRYVVNTHYHADHSTGTYLFDDVKVIAHCLCRDYLDTRGRESLARAAKTIPEMHDVSIVLPDIVFSDRFMLQFGGKTFEFWSTPGHSMDSIVCLVQEQQILFAADTVMPVPFFVDGDRDAFLSSLSSLQGVPYETIVQGHGEIVLRGEVEEKIQSDIDYLYALQNQVDSVLDSVPDDGDALSRALAAIDIESCGKPRVLLNGMVEQLHQQNVSQLARMRRNGLSIEWPDR